MNIGQAALLMAHKGNNTTVWKPAGLGLRSAVSFSAKRNHCASSALGGGRASVHVCCPEPSKINKMHVEFKHLCDPGCNFILNAWSTSGGQYFRINYRFKGTRFLFVCIAFFKQILLHAAAVACRGCLMLPGGSKLCAS